MSLSSSNLHVLPFRRTTPKKPSAKPAIAGGIAPVIRLFAARPAQREYFPALLHIESVSIGGEARIKLLVDGELPTEYLESLTCRIECPLMDIDTKSALRFISREGDTVTMLTVMLRPQWNETLSPGPQATLCIVGPDGEMLQERLVPMLLAAMM